MILDNLSRAFKTQNWLAAGVEFVIVVAGVVIGFQVSQFAATRAEERRAAELIELVGAEMQANLATIRHHSQLIARDTNSVIELQLTLANFGSETDTQRLDLQLAVAMTTRTLELETTALDQLEAPGNRQFIRGSPLEDAIRTWRVTVQRIKGTEQSLEGTNSIEWEDRFPAVSLEAVSGSIPSPDLAAVVPPRFPTDWTTLSNDSAFAGRMAMIALNLEYLWARTDRLEEHTLALIDASQAVNVR